MAGSPTALPSLAFQFPEMESGQVLPWVQGCSQGSTGSCVPSSLEGLALVWKQLGPSVAQDMVFRAQSL